MDSSVRGVGELASRHGKRRRGWDSNHCWVLKRKNLTAFTFLTIRQIRAKALVETRIEHVAVRAVAIRGPAHVESRRRTMWVHRSVGADGGTRRECECEVQLRPRDRASLGRWVPETWVSGN
jgi:hypothetical protein